MTVDCTAAGCRISSGKLQKEMARLNAPATTNENHQPWLLMLVYQILKCRQLVKTATESTTD